MARKTVSQQLAELREYTSKLEDELKGQREIADTTQKLAADLCDVITQRDLRIAGLKNQIDQMATTEGCPPEVLALSGRSLTLGELSMEYCRQFNCKSATPDQLREYAAAVGVAVVRSF